ncbi:SoxR reducing system RseC family protein [Vreelandella arcis]|uniref:Positive regulator of sigma(E), RseC/MucC n=1 Tax=Vreelandella arcis TaxID=416873 RepID=A0A1G9ZRX4_9GAMM|nr:SoxR reducing system RseC family protein [Halomonas arcis]SDN23865.1 positive regulator of sigma(E), RseC/MucC [Halomonas arcis]
MSATTGEQVVQRQGRVVGYRTQGVVVEVIASPGCTQCAKGQGCGAGLLARRNPWQLKVDTPLSYKDKTSPALNSEVTLVMQKATITRLTWLIYGLPLLIALAGAGVGDALSDAVWLAPSLFFGLLISSMLGLKYALGRRAEYFRPRLVDA